MTPETKQTWLTALRSGKYPKTTKHLKDHEGFCCLGVLLEVAGPGFTDVVRDRSNLGVETTDQNSRQAWFMPKEFVDDESGSTRGANSGNELSQFAMEKFGMLRDQHDMLTEINDEQNTFDGVIEYIEREL